MIKIMLKIFICSLLVSFLLPVSSIGQDESFRIKLESTINRYKNWRFSNISLYELKNINDVRKAIQTKEQKSRAPKTGTNEGGGEPAALKTTDKNVLSLIDNGVQKNQSQGRISREIIGRGLTPPSPEDMKSLYDYYVLKNGPGTVKQLRKGYLITTRMLPQQIVPVTIIALLVTTEDIDDIKKNIDRITGTNIYTYDEMKQFDLDKVEYGSENMYDLMMNAFLQTNVTNRTLEAQGIGTLLSFFPRVAGQSKSLINVEADINNEDIQSFMRISDGMPMDYKLKENELIVSPDLISWRRYDLKVAQTNDGGYDTLSVTTNKDLPRIGIELRYGIDDMNYSSLWSERLNISALWKSVKLGIIAPTNGWSSLSKDMFNQDRKLTYGGIGVSGAVDFPIKIIPQSAVFHLSGGYVFGDAKAADYKNRKLSADNFNEVYPGFNDFMKYDYLIRTDAQLHYTFAIAVDEDYMLRFGIGGSFYNVEKWGYKLDEFDPSKLVYYKVKDETKGGISGRIEFMARNVATPYGGSLQYFDEALSADIWLQIPVIENMLAIRLDAKGYFTSFRSNPYAWENKSVFTPMARLIVNF